MKKMIKVLLSVVMVTAIFGCAKQKEEELLSEFEKMLAS